MSEKLLPAQGCQRTVSHAKDVLIVLATFRGHIELMHTEPRKPLVVINCALGANKVRADGGWLVSIAWFELVGLLRLVVVCVSLHVRAHQPSGSLQLRRHHVRQSTGVAAARLREATRGFYMIS